MKPSEVAVVLAKAAAYDRRTVGEADVAAWHEVLADVDFTAALAAVAAHYRDSTDWLMPAQLREHVAAARRVEVSRVLTAAKAAPECVHGVPGGEVLHPMSAQPICPQCRLERLKIAS